MWEGIMALMLYAGTNVNLYYYYQYKSNKGGGGGIGKTSYLLKEADGILYRMFIFSLPHFLTYLGFHLQHFLGFNSGLSSYVNRLSE